MNITLKQIGNAISNRFPWITLSFLGAIAYNFYVELQLGLDRVMAAPLENADFARIIYIKTGAISTLFYEPWRFFTSTFVHGDWEHIFGNSLLILVLGIILESFIKIPRFLYFLIIFLSAGVSSYVDFSLSTSMYENYISFGASGVDFGLLGATLGYFLASYIRKNNIKSLLIDGFAVASLSGFAGLSLYFIPLSDYGIDPTNMTVVSHSAHITGFFVGILTFMAYLAMKFIYNNIEKPITEKIYAVGVWVSLKLAFIGWMSVIATEYYIKSFTEDNTLYLLGATLGIYAFSYSIYSIVSTLYSHYWKSFQAFNRNLIEEIQVKINL